MIKDTQRAIVLPLLRDALGGAGFFCAIAGVWQMSHSAALIVVGLTMVGIAALWGRAG